MKKILAILLAAASLFIMTSCGKVKFEYADGKLINTKSKAAYNPLPMGFEPCGVGDVYGQFGAFVLYRVETLDGSELPAEIWLTEEYAGNATVVYLSEKEAVPSFKNMSFDSCYICQEDEAVMAIAEIDDKELIKNIVSSLDFENRALWPRTDIKASYSLKLHSNEYPGIFYSLVYCVCESGCYIYDRASNTCVESGDMLSAYVNAE